MPKYLATAVGVVALLVFVVLAVAGADVPVFVWVLLGYAVVSGVAVDVLRARTRT